MAPNAGLMRLSVSISVPNTSVACDKERGVILGYFLTSHSLKRRFSLKLVAKSQRDKWRLTDFDANAVQETLSTWVSKTQNLLNDVALPLIKPGHTAKADPSPGYDAEDMEGLLVPERTIDSVTPNGKLSAAAVISIEQFSRMSGLTGQRMQNIFRTLVPRNLYMDPRYLVEYCCFRFLSRDTSEIHPCLKDIAFQRLIFITMLAWENPYCEESHADNVAPEKSFQGKLVGEEAFVRIAPAISGVGDRSTVHNLFKSLAGGADRQGISLGIWLTYIGELLKVHEGRKSYHVHEWPQLSFERILCLASSRKRPVLKWENNVAWPGKLSLTDKALYFEPVGLAGQKAVMRFDLTKHGVHVEKAKVGPFGSALFDSAVSISSGPRCETWVLEFVELGVELRRDVWHAFISEVIALHSFLREYGPDDTDESLNHVFGAKKGREKATASASNSIARLHALQFMHKLPDDPIRLMQFSYLRNVPYGDIVLQTLAVNFWGGALVTRVTETAHRQSQLARPSEDLIENTNNVSDIDGSVYLQKWMKSPSWASSASINFWRNSSSRQGVVLSKNVAVGDLTLVERAAETCRLKCQMVEITQATIDAAMIKGIPSNIDLFKELMLPLTVLAKNFGKLRRWEKPYLTVTVLVCMYTIIFRNLLYYVFPVSLMLLGTGMLILKGLRGQGRLGRSFGKVTIRDQPPSNTIQKIIAVKNAMQDVENYLQDLNIVLLKLRTIILSGHPQELEFRREMVRRFISFLKERWETVPAAPVVVLPFEGNDSSSSDERERPSQGSESGGKFG